MKVFHVITGLGNGGAEAVMFSLITSEQQNVNDHHVVSLTGLGVYGERLIKAGIAVNALDMPRGRATLIGLFKLYKLFKQANPDVVHTWMYHANLVGGIIAKFAGVKLIIWGIRHGNFDPAYNNPVTLRIIKLCAYLSNWVPAKIVSCSGKASLLHQALGYHPDKFVNIPNGYALARLKPDPRARDAIREEFSIPKNAFVFGMVARFDPQKDHQNLITALGQVNRLGKNIFCLLVGDGMDASNVTLVTQINASGLAEIVRLVGGRKDIPAVMNALDVHVLSSLGEAFPNVLAESMACGTPCVTTDVGDAAYIVGDTGWVVRPQDSNALALGMQLALEAFSDRSSWMVRQSAARLRIEENFTIERVVTMYDAVWRTGFEKG